MTSKQRYPIKVTIYTTLIFVILAIITSATLLQYRFSFEQAESVALNQFNKIADQTSRSTLELENLGRSYALAIRHSNSLDLSLDGTGTHPLINQMTDMMIHNEGVFSLFTGFANGDYIEVIDITTDGNIRKRYGATMSDRWIVNEVLNQGNTRVKNTHYLEDELNIRTTTSEETDYDPRTRPWYKKAVVNEVQHTNPYVLEFAQLPATSYVIRNSANTVTGSITLLSTLNKTLDNASYPKTYQAILFNENRTVLANSESVANEYDNKMDSLTEILISEGLDLHDLSQQKLEVVNYKDQTFYRYIKLLGDIAEDQEHIGILVAQSEVLEPYTKHLQHSLLISLLILSFSIPLMWYIAYRITNPIIRVTQENLKVKQRRYSEVKYHNSRFKELHELSQSMVDMAREIQSYELAQRELMDAFIKLIAEAIDKKSPYTGGHCERVPLIAELLAKAASEASEGPFKDFVFSTEAQWREFTIAAWLHDCGKITTPEHIVDKGSKLEAIYNRIHEIRMRFEVIWRDAEIVFLKQLQHHPDKKQKLLEDLTSRQEQIKEDFAFVASCNVGGEFMDEVQIERLQSIAKTTWTRYLDNRLGLSPVEEQHLADFTEKTPAQEQLLMDKPEHQILRTDKERELDSKFTMQPPRAVQNLGEIYNLSIKRGTLTDEDRYIINEHITTTIQMLETLPFPQDLKQVPEYAGGHHEKMNGEGYPRSLTAEQLSIPAKIMAVADIFEALTASDRPYKKAKTLSESLKIMSFMVKDQHIDKDLFELFLQSGIYLDYAKRVLKSEQIDEVNINDYIS